MSHPVDVHVGKKIRQRRWAVGATQAHLADEVGIKFQQIQKYETGANRVSASRLWDIAVVLDVPVDYFFAGLEGATPRSAPHGADDLLADREAIDLLRAYYAIPEPQRRRLYDLARALSDTVTAAPAERRSAQLTASR